MIPLSNVRYNRGRRQGQYHRIVSAVMSHPSLLYNSDISQLFSCPSPGLCLQSTQLFTTLPTTITPHRFNDLELYPNLTSSACSIRILCVLFYTCILAFGILHLSEKCLPCLSVLDISVMYIFFYKLY